MFWTKGENTITAKQKKQAFKSLPEPGMEPGTSRTAVRRSLMRYL